MIRKLVVAILVVQLLAACSNDDPPVMLDISGKAASDAGKARLVCADGNRNWTCDAGEPQVEPAEDGSFVLSVPERAVLGLQTLFLVAELGQEPPFALIVPVTMSPSFSALGTLLSVQMVDSESSLPDAQAAVRAALSLPDTLDLTQGPFNEAPAVTLEPLVLAAIRQGSRAYLESMSEAGAGGAAVRAARAALDTLSRYIDADTGLPLPGVTGKTLIGETVGTLVPPTCSIRPPPMMRISTEDNAPIVSREDYVNARLEIDPTADFPDAIDVTTRIRGRGNTTWRKFPKKPYRLKLDDKASLLGMSPEKDWALLANYSDKTLMRNAVAMCLGKLLEMDYTTATQAVELTLNGDYLGVYGLTEHVEVSDERVVISREPDSDSDRNIGFLVEIDSRLDGEFAFRSSRGLPYVIKSDTNAAQATTIASLINEMESAVFSASFKDTEIGYLRYIDVESLIDFYLVNELVRNNDVFFSSTFIHRDYGGKFVFGPLWDFDIAAGNINYNGNWNPEGWWVREVSKYVKRLLADPRFEQQVNARWQYFYALQSQMHRYLDETETILDDAQRRNFERWDILSTQVWPNVYVFGTYAGEVDYLRNWLTNRAAWMDGQLSPAEVDSGQGE